MNIQLTRAVLIPVDSNNQPAPISEYIPVQFNPNSLRVTLSNTVAAQNNAGSHASANAGQSSAAQFIDKSESSLSIQLIFDTTIAGTVNNLLYDENEGKNQSPSQPNSSAGADTDNHDASNHPAGYDVRKLTKKIADTFMKPDDSSHNQQNKPAAPKRCRFQWGSFSFTGMVNSYNETLDFFSPEGVPMRSTLALSLKEDRYQYDIGNAQNAARKEPQFSTAAPESGVAQAAAAQGADPKNWRDLALFNGIEDARSIGMQALMVPQASFDQMNSLAGAPEVGFSVGASVSLGSSIPNAFSWK